MLQISAEGRIAVYQKTHCLAMPVVQFHVNIPTWPTKSSRETGRKNQEIQIDIEVPEKTFLLNTF